MNPRKLLARIAESQANVRFSDLVRLVRALGFVLDRVSGSHHIFIHRTHTEAQLNLQPDRGDVKPYQVRQFLKLVELYNLTIDGDA